MRFISILIIPYLLFGWSFTKAHYSSLSDAQMSVIDVSYEIGQPYGLGLTLATIAIVETRADHSFDKNKNHVCGVHQINTDFTEETCEELESSYATSAEASLANLLFWKKKYPNASLDQILTYYNGGDVYENPHKEEYLRRVVNVYTVLKKNYIH